MSVTVEVSRLSPVPLYHQLATQLRRAITSGDLPKGAFLDNEIDLAEQWQVSRPTVRRAIRQLVDEGLLVRRRGIGTQVVSVDVRRQLTLSSLHDDIAAAGRTPGTDIVHFERRPMPADVAEELGVDEGTEAVHLVRVRTTDGSPLAVIRNWLLADIAEHVTPSALASSGLYALLRASGTRPHSARQRLGARAADEVDAELLGLVPGAPLVTMHRVMQDDTGRVVEVADTVYDAERYTVEVSVVSP